MRRVVLALVLLMIGLAGDPARARADVNVTIDSARAAEFARLTGLQPAAVEAQLKMEIERLFQTYRLGEYLQSYGDAHAFTTRGLGVDYASDLRFVEIGVAANVAVNSDDAFNPDDLRSKPALEGVSTNFTVMGGLNFGFLGARPFTLFANYFKGETSFGEYGADLDNWGVHGQLRLFAPTDESALHALVRWGGIAITTGFEHARTKLNLTKDLKRDITLPNVPRSAGFLRVDMNDGTLTVNTSTSSVPIEVTTSLRLLYLVTVYGGLGFDWQVGGQSDLAIAVNGKLTGIVTGSPDVDLGTTAVAARESSDPSAGRMRGLLGVQVNLSIVRLFVQTNVIPDPASASVAFGLRLAY